MMLQAGRAQDYVIGTGITHSVGWVLEFVFKELDLNCASMWFAILLCIERMKEVCFVPTSQKLDQNLAGDRQQNFAEVLRMMIENEVNNPTY